MIDSDLYGSYDSALRTLDELTRRSVRYLVSLLKDYPDDQLEAALSRHLPAVVTFYGRAAAQAAVEFYREEREASGASDDYDPKAAEPISAQWVREDVSEAMGPQRKGTSDRVSLADNLAGRAVRRVRGRADRTIIHGCKSDPANPRWAIVPHVGACPWCIMYSSWGFHYRSESSAKAQRHANCQCVVVKDSDTDNPSLEGYDPDGMRERLLQCGRDFGADGEDWDRSIEAAKFYDREWLRTGARPEVGYSSDDVWEKKWRDPQSHGLERGTAEILADHGLRAVFWDDELYIPLDGGSGVRTIGQSDLDTGIELKTVYAATSSNTFDSHVRSGRKKDSALIVFDISQNTMLDDNQAASMIADACRNRGVPGSLMITHERELKWVPRA